MEKFLNSVLMDGKRVEEQPINLAGLGDKLLGRALEFINGRGNESRPFALYYSFPNVHVPLVPGKRFRGKSEHGAYGDRSVLYIEVIQLHI